jgi:hypothetical protein
VNAPVDAKKNMPIKQEARRMPSVSGSSDIA